MSKSIEEKLSAITTGLVFKESRNCGCIDNNPVDDSVAIPVQRKFAGTDNQDGDIFICTDCGSRNIWVDGKWTIIKTIPFGAQ